MSDKFEKANDILDTSTRAVGLLGVAAWAGMAICWCGSTVIGMIKEHRSKKHKDGYVEGYIEGFKKSQEIHETLKEKNDELLNEAIARTEGAAE